jgi:hypothetical protein
MKTTSSLCSIICDKCTKETQGDWIVKDKSLDVIFKALVWIITDVLV